MILEIFKAGTHTDSQGRTRTYTEKDLDQIVNSYKPAEREAPLVLGHPKDNDPAYGWVEKLYRKGKSLFAKTKDEDPAFLKAVKERKFPKRSISLTEKLRLNHIGFLGAALPAVDGLAEIAFNEKDEFAVIEFDEKLNFENDSAATHNNESGDGANPKPKNPENHNTSDDTQNPSLGSYSSMLNDISETLDQVKTLTEDFTKNFKSNHSADLSDKEKKQIREQLETLNMKLSVNNFEVMLNEKLLYGSLTPVMKDKITKTIRFISNQNFSEFNSDKFVVELKSQLMDFVNSIPKIIEYSDFAEKPEVEPDENLVDSDYGGLAVDEVSNSFHKKVLRKMKEKDLDYASALKLVTINS
jgi:hypothetical protein